MANKSQLYISGSVLLITVLCYYTRSSIPIDITLNTVEQVFAYLGLLNTILFIYIISKTSLSKWSKSILGIMLITHGLLLTIYHVRWYPGWEDVEIIDQNNSEITMRQIQKLGFNNADKNRIIRAKKIIPSIRIILETEEL